MTVTTTTLTRAAGLCAVAAGLLFVGVQINHPHLDATFVTTTDWTVRETIKIFMAVLSLAGITGMYLRQVRQTRLLGLLGYLLFGAGYLAIMSVEVVGLCVLPALAHGEPGHVNNVLAVATGGHATGDVGLMQPLLLVSGITYLGGGLLFGIALFRANILARWAAALLAVGTLATAAIPVLPQINERLFAIPTGAALIGLGFSLWREQRTPAARPMPNPVSSPLDPAGVQLTIQPAARPTRSTRSTRGPGWVPFSLVALVLVPATAGSARLVQLAGGPQVMPADPRLSASPMPVVVHIVCAVAYAILGAFQFSTALRAHRPGWHRVAGRVLVVLGLTVAFSALWMAQFYPRQPGTDQLTYLFRLTFGSGMAASILLGLGAIRRGDVARPGMDDPRLRPRRRHPGVHPKHRHRGPRHQHQRPHAGRGLGHQPRGRRVRHPPADQQPPNRQGDDDGSGLMVPSPRRQAPAFYRIRVDGRLDAHWSAWFADLTLTHDGGGTTNLSGLVSDQAMLHGLHAQRDPAGPAVGRGR